MNITMPKSLVTLQKVMPSAGSLVGGGNILPLKERLDTYRNLYLYLTSNMDPELLFTKKRRAGSQTKRKVYRKISQRLSEGVSLSEAMSPFLPPDELVFLKAAEKQNSSADMMKNLVDMVTSKRAQVDEFRSGMVMPVGVFVMVIIALLVSAFVVSPQIMTAVGNDATKFLWFPEIILPAAKALIFLSALLFPLILIALAVYLPNSSRHGARKVLDNVFPFSVYKDLQSSLFLIVISGGMAGGLTYLTALELQVGSSTRYLRSWLSTMMSRFRSGEYNDVDAIDVGLIPAEEVDLIDDLSATKSFASAMLMIGSESMERARKRAKATFKITTLIIAVVGILIAFGFYGSLIGYAIANVNFS